MASLLRFLRVALRSNWELRWLLAASLQEDNKVRPGGVGITKWKRRQVGVHILRRTPNARDSAVRLGRIDVQAIRFSADFGPQCGM